MKMKVLQNSSYIWGLGWLGNLCFINMSQYMNKKSPGNKGTGSSRAVGEGDQQNHQVLSDLHSGVTTLCS